MDQPTMFEPYQAAPDIWVLPAFFPIPALGIVPVNSFLLKTADPVLVDTGLVPLAATFMEKLSSLIDPGDLRWLWLTHTDQDHIGSLPILLEKAPNLRVITTFLGVGKMSLFQPLPMDRVFLLNPGQSMRVGDRTLTAVRPPTFDAPETTGFHDAKSAAFFSADCFGALLSEPAQDIATIGSRALREGVSTWSRIDAPWLHQVDRTQFAATLNRVREMAPKIIFSSHLPVAVDMTEELLGYLAAVPAGEPFVGPDQQGLEAMLRGT